MQHLKTHLLATVAALAVTGTASAADLRMPVKAPPPVVQVMTWTGPYIGINGGAVWHRATTDYEVGSFFESVRTTSTGATFGGQIGYNWQVQNFVFGLEADGNLADASKTVTSTNTVTYHNKLSWLATVRGRLGVTITPPTLLYVTGGLAVGGIKNTAGGNGLVTLVNDDTKTGWTIGGGIEHMFSPNWTVKLEGLYVDLGKDTISGPDGYVGHFKNTAVIARAGINLKW